MSDPVALPFWVFLVVLLFAAWAAYEHLVIPALRWMVAHPANRLMDELSMRLRIGIRPFQRTRRQALIHRLLTDPKVQQAAEQHASRNGISIHKALKQVETIRGKSSQRSTPTSTSASATGSAARSRRRSIACAWASSTPRA